MIRLLSASMLLAACSGGHTGLAPSSPQAGTCKFPDGPPLVTPGEHMAYKLSLGGIELATYELAAGEPSELDGKKVIEVQGHAKAIGLVKVVANIDDRFTSWIDVTTGRPIKFQTDEYATKSEDVEHSLAQISARTGDTVPVTFHLNDQPATPEPQKVAFPDVWDYNAFLVALRSWEGPVGCKATAEVLRSRYLWHVEMTIAEKTKLVTDLGEFPALHLKGHTYKLGRDGTKLADSDERDFSVWISDDDGRVPLKINTRTDYGDVKMQLVDYQTGNGQRLRE